jgi:hypothetical protein
MELLEPTTVEDLVSVHAPELIPRRDPVVRGVMMVLVFALSATIGIPISTALSLPAGAAALLAAFTGAVAAAGVDWSMRRDHHAAMARFQERMRDSPWLIYDAVASKFLGEIDHQRARTIGPESEWGQARSKLEGAAHEASRSVAYWHQRTSVQPDEFSRDHLAAAARLEAKFKAALSGLDQRAETLVAFFNECEARVAVLQSTKRDFEEIKKLERLSDSSEELVANAENTLVAIASNFASEALRVGTALGGLERVGLTSLAGEASIDHLEAFADRVVEGAARDREALERVTRGAV